MDDVFSTRVTLPSGRVGAVDIRRVDGVWNATLRLDNQDYPLGRFYPASFEGLCEQVAQSLRGFCAQGRAEIQAKLQLWDES